MSYRLLSMAALAAVLSACQRAELPEPPPRPVLTQLVQMRQSDAFDGYAGEVRAHWEADLSFRVPGKVTSRPVDIGVSVTKGEVLAKLDPSDLSLQVNASRAAVTAARSDLRTAEAELQRHRELLERKLIGTALYEAKLNAHSAAQARLKQASSEDEVARNQADYAVLRAPRAGLISTITVEPGQVVSAGQTVLRMADPSRKEIWIAIPEDRIESMALGRVALMHPTAIADRHYRGKIREISSRADPATRTYLVKIAVDDADSGLALGMSVAVGLPDPAAVPVVRVPLQAVTARGDEHFVYVYRAEDSTVHAQPVTVKQFREDGADISNGLADGDRIVTAGVQRLIDGQTVRLSESASGT